MEAVEAKSSSSSGYGKPPWVFRGSALYQLHLVKAEKARRYIPKEFKLVEAFGYTLGGFFLASYEDSPAGVFDELVVIAGLVWNRPTSCAWATRVYVNSNDACYHGRKEVGLPSQIAKFSKTIRAISGEPSDRSSGFLNMIGIGSISCNNQRDQGLNVEVIKIKCLEAADACNISLTSADGEWIWLLIWFRASYIMLYMWEAPIAGWGLQSKCRFQVSVVVQSIILISLSTLAGLNAGCKQCSH
ncbi:protein NEOXANTHIN-DEFICIENT 1 isoform X4 [Arachis hypogaea]|uniref:protein NEOXANTHIN-DEFICIENT 1 isoform X4 n=1 Tax=Arachis hypogaea TaxID=3818 RepID=UPI0034E624FB